MKKIILFITFSVFCINFYGQEKNYLSTEFDVNYNYCFTGNNTHNNFSYGFSLLVSEYINKIKISAGINYSRLYYDYNMEDLFYSIKKREYKLEYLKFPVISSFKIFSGNRTSISILTGFVFSSVIGYSIKPYYLNGKTITENDLLGQRQLGVSWLLGITFSKMLDNKLLLNISPFFNYPIIPNGRNQIPGYNNIPNYISLGAKIGIEYLFKDYNSE